MTAFMSGKQRSKFSLSIASIAAFGNLAENPSGPQGTVRRYPVGLSTPCR
jgi:hypothetical protein